jgi:hypothetical protein
VRKISHGRPGSLQPAGARARSCLLLAALPLGCNPPPTEGCGHGEIELALDPARGGFPPLSEGGEVPVFIPPQGGIFTELDLVTRGIAVETITFVQVTIDSDAGERVAEQPYPGYAVPLLCIGDDTAYVPRMPVRFAEGLVLEALEGVEGELELVLEASGAEHTRRWSVVLRVTGY